MFSTRSASIPPSGRYRSGVGLNPFRAHVSRRSDLAVVIVALAVVVALVLWGFFG